MPPFPARWRAILRRNVPYYLRLPPTVRARLEALTAVFVAEKEFEPCGGLRLNDEVRVTVAGLACLLLLHRGPACYPELRSVLVYPGAYRVHARRHGEDGVVVEGPEGRQGQSAAGVVVLAWDKVRPGTPGAPRRGNLVLHEFAHHLAHETGSSDGIPLWGAGRDRVWREALERGFARLTREVDAGRARALDAYGATGRAEFFAVLTEAFFERPEELEPWDPALYRILKDFYGQDPRDPGRGFPT